MTFRGSAIFSALTRIATAFLFCFPSPAHTQDSSSLLWEISGGGLEKKSYLFGTIHLFCPGDFVVGDSLKSRLLASENLVLEIDMTDPELMPALMQGMMMKDGSTLRGLLSGPEYEKIDLFFSDSIGFNITPFAGSKPYLLTSLLYNYALQCHQQSVEEQLTILAGEKGIRIAGLETPQEQTALFDLIPYRTQAEMVLRMIDSIHIAQREFRELMHLYQSQDIQKLYEYVRNSKSDFNGFENILLADRNRKWISRIEKFITGTSSLIAVGAAHLGGDDGLVQLLRAKGYRVLPVHNP